jgi:2-polyprenyl-3-methyl-5-hydroxy-6-metoxy-1,4-benzoquinol methylase
MYQASVPRERSSRHLPLRSEKVVLFQGSEPRVVLPELLDSLPQDSPAAQASRRDLRIINRLLGSTVWFKKTLKELHQHGEAVLEIGAGTGELGRALNARMPNVAGLDLCARPLDWPQTATWFQSNVRDFTGWSDYPIVISNLFFHHFDPEGLAQLGRKLNENARVIIASDPLRARRTWRLFSLLCPLIQAHPVTRYDGCVSIAAGFKQEELPRLLQLDPSIWDWHVHESWLGSSRLVAVRRV